ncbi:MAG: Spy/CpxP family protein refolding chaperone [Psychrosphaera sp.]|nr:Spy/CpxP family protein refolding chaperone [Psychrosphaera sp.]
MKKILSVLSLGLALAFGGVAMAEGDRSSERHSDHSAERGHGGNGQHHMMKRMFSKLDLSEEQQTAIKDLKEQMHADMQTLRAARSEEGQRSDFRDQMKAITQAETFDEDAFRELLAVKQAKKIEAGVMKAKMKNGVWNILNTEQQAKMTEMIQSRGERHGKRQMRRHGGGDFNK